MPRLSAHVSTTPAQNSNHNSNPSNSDMIQGVVAEFNKYRTSHSNTQSAQQMGQTNTVPSTSQDPNNFSNPPAEVGENLLSSTFTTYGEQTANSRYDSEDSDSDDPDMSDVFIDSKTKKCDYKSYFVHWRAKQEIR